MTTKEKTYRCNSCKADGIKRAALSFKCSQILISKSSTMDNHNRQIITDITIRSWRYLCERCVAAESNRDNMHRNTNNGSIINCGSDEWVSFCKEYQDIAAKFGFGKGKDKYGQYSPYIEIKDNNKWLGYGTFRNISVFQYFTLKQAVKDKPDDSKEPLYDTTGSQFTDKEFNALLDWLKDQDFCQIMKRADFFKENGLSEHMKGKGHPFRKPTSYDGLLGRVETKCRTDKVHKLLKNNTTKDKYTKLMKDIEDKKHEKYDMDKTKESAIKAAKSGMFAKDKRLTNKKGTKNKNGTGIINDKLNDHAKDYKDSNYYKDQRLLIQRETSSTLQVIGNNMRFLAFTVDDYWSDLIVFVDMNYDGSDRKSLMNVIEKNKSKFVIKWRCVVQSGATFTVEQKKKLIKNTLEDLGSGV